MTFQSTKTYGHNIGLSVAFRQWRAESHCRLQHGYAMSFKFIFESEHLNDKNWVIDFGGLKSLKNKLEDLFDHTMLVANDDPKKEILLDLDRIHNVAKVVLVDSTGCEAMAKMAFDLAVTWVKEHGEMDRVKVVSVEAAEHGANSALFLGYK